MTVTLDRAETVAKELAEVIAADIDPKAIAKEWRLEFASWTDGELAEAAKRWGVAKGGEMLVTFPQPKELRPFRPDPVQDAKRLKDERLACICDGDGKTTWAADNAPGSPDHMKGQPGRRVSNGPAGETVVIPCYYCARTEFEVWWHEVTIETWNGNTAPEWASTPRPETDPA